MSAPNILCNTAGMTNDEWLATRMHGPAGDIPYTVGGSDVAAIFGVSPWTTPMELWMIKKGRMKPPVKSNASQLEMGHTRWLETVIKRARIDYLRKYENHPEIISYEDIPEAERIAPPFEDQWGYGGRSQTPYDFEEERLAKAFIELPLKRRQVMELLFLEGMSEAETARRLNCSLQYVRNQRCIALKKLRSRLTEGGDEK